MYDDTNTKKTFLEKVLMLTERQLCGDGATEDAGANAGGFSAEDLDHIKEAVGAWMEEGEVEGAEGDNDSQASTE